ncbi:hypothetical protein ACE6H2_010813 [Prunus campanulata]
MEKKLKQNWENIMNVIRVEKPFSEILMVSNASSRASPRLEGCMKDMEVIWDEFE